MGDSQKLDAELLKHEGPIEGGLELWLKANVSGNWYFDRWAFKEETIMEARQAAENKGYKTAIARVASRRVASRVHRGG